MTDTHAMHNFDVVLTEIIAERQRQIAKGFTAEHDDALPAPALAVRAIERIHYACREDLIEAAALIVAAIQRLDRKALKDAEGN